MLFGRVGETRMIEKWEYPDVVIALLGERGVMGHSGVEDKCHCLSAMTGYGLVFGVGLWSRPNFSDIDSDSDSGLEKSTPTPTPTPTPTTTHISLFFFTCRQ